MSSQTTLPHVYFGNSNLKVSRVILGCMTYGGSSNEAPMLSEEESLKLIKLAHDMGIRAFDTSNPQLNGQSEVILGKAIKQFGFRREEIVVMTKIFAEVNEAGIPSSSLGSYGPGHTQQHGLSRKIIIHSVKSSLNRLQLDYIDLLQCHGYDKYTPVEETMQALDDLIQAGYIRYIGISGCQRLQVNFMQNYAITHNLTLFISIQNQYSLVYRDDERDMFPALKAMRNAAEHVIDHRGTYSISVRHQLVKEGIEQLAMRKGANVSRLLCAWALQRSGTSAVIINTTSLQKLEETVGAAKVKLSDAEMEFLERQYRTASPH